MSWSRKEQPSPFDTRPIEGLFFLDGDQLARTLKIDWTKGEKSPMIAFPSGLSFELWESSDPQGGTVHLFGEMDLPLNDTRQSAYLLASGVAEEVGYVVQKRGETQLEIIGHDTDEYLRITYDDVARRMVNVEPVVQAERQQSQRQQLLTDEIRAKLPPLGTNEHFGLNAVAQVKFFTPDGNWTWYATEFDGQDVFFGLVAGFEVELGSFSLSELQDVRGLFGLPIERDRYFEPTTLKELMKYHRNL
jgi:hypothetical protein